MKKLLLVEDDKSLGKTLIERLTKEKLSVIWCESMSSAREKFLNEKFDLIILDVGLSDGSGFDFAREVRNSSTVPFLFVTAQGSAEDRLLGYELGAEEYIPKPFHLKELLMRIEHVLENHAKGSELSVEDIVIDFSAMMIRHKNKNEKLNLKELQLLKILIDKSPKVLSRDDILNAVWGESQFPTNRTVDNIIVRLRSLLGESAGAYIKSVRGVGYQWLRGEW